MNADVRVCCAERQMTPADSGEKKIVAPEKARDHTAVANLPFLCFLIHVGDSVKWLSWLLARRFAKFEFLFMSIVLI